MYEYHFATNRRLWDDHIAVLTDEQYTQEIAYSLRSVRNHCVHLVDVDNGWFAALRGDPDPPVLDPVQYPERDKLRAQWNAVEATMRDYLTGLTDDMLNMQPFSQDANPLRVWQVLQHVIIHGTDHRAQLLQLLYGMGQTTPEQDYALFSRDHR